MLLPCVQGFGEYGITFIQRKEIVMHTIWFALPDDRTMVRSIEVPACDSCDWWDRLEMGGFLMVSQRPWRD